MRLATVLTPLSDHNLRLASQAGVSDLAVRYPGPEPGALRRLQRRVAAFGLRLGVVEGDLPIENIKLGNPLRDQDIAAVKRLLQDMGRCGVPILCYNFMAGTDWVRTRLDVPERGGALVTAFDLAEAESAVSLARDPHRVTTEHIDAETLWDRLAVFLREVLPVAERAGVLLAMHPDDPPLDAFLGRARIMNRIESFERLLELVPSPSNAICFCQGTFAEMGEDIPAAIERLGSKICYVHFRDIEGHRTRFRETFHDNGPTDMVAAMRAYRRIGFDGPIRPDHVPQMSGEEQGEPGYTMLGRLFAFGYLRGLMQAVAQEPHDRQQ